MSQWGEGPRHGGSLEILIEAGGAHQFDLGHLRRQGAARLVRLLLQSAGQRQPLLWRLRVEKKFGCGSETRAITVVGSKPWCCYLKVKPGDNDTAHYCSLLMPSGLNGEAIYDALKDAEERVSRAWRRGFEGEVVPLNDDELTGAETPDPKNGAPDAAVSRLTAAREVARLLFEPPAAPPALAAAPLPAASATGPPALAAPALPDAGATGPPASADAAAGDWDEDGEEVEVETATELLGWSQDSDKLRLTLLAIHELSQGGTSKDLEEFVTALSAKLGWQGLRRKQIGGVFTALVRRGRVVRVYRGSRSLGYALTEEGRRLIRDLMPDGGPVPHLPAPPEPALPAEAGRDPVRLLAALEGVARSFTSSYQKLQDNRKRRAELVAELGRLDAEAAALSRFVNNPEVQALLERLTQLSGPGTAD